MTASIEHTKRLYYRLTERIPQSDVEDIFERVLRRQRESGESIEAARQRLHEQAWKDAVATAQEVAYKNALKQSGLRPVSERQFEWKRDENREDYQFTARFEVLPSIDISLLDEIEIERPEAEVTDDDVSHALEVLLGEHKIFEPVARSAQLRDRVTFDYEGTINGAPFEGSALEGACVVIGEGDVLEDVEVALIGRSSGDDFRALITFPDDYSKPSLRGEEVEFHIRVHEVAAPELPTLDSAMVKRLGVESGSVEELRAQLHEQLTSEAEHRIERYERQQLGDALIDAIPVTVPDTLLEHEIERMRTTFESGASVPPDAAADGPLPEQPLRETAERRVALSLILSEIIREYDIRLNQARVDQKLGELAEKFAFTDAEAIKRQYRDDAQLMHNVQALVIEEQAFETAFEHVRMIPVSMSLDTLLRRTEVD